MLFMVPVVAIAAALVAERCAAPAGDVYSGQYVPDCLWGSYVQSATDEYIAWAEEAFPGAVSFDRESGLVLIRNLRGVKGRTYFSVYREIRDKARKIARQHRAVPVRPAFAQQATSNDYEVRFGEPGSTTFCYPPSDKS